MSAFIEKAKLIGWLKERSTSGWWYEETNEAMSCFDYAYGVRAVLWEVEQGLFDWAGESE
jgi:hypothetical protein